MAKAKRRMITNSTRAMWLTCQTRFRYAVLERTVPKRKALPLSFGTLLHNILETYYRNGGGGMAFADGLIAEWLSDQERHLSEQEFMDYKAQGKVRALADVARSIAGRYVEKYPHDLDEYRVVGVEEMFRAPILTPKGNKSTWDFGGKVDLMLEDEGGRLWIMDHKTTQETRPDAVEINIELDGQPRGYIWGIQQVKGVTVYGMIYNVMRKKVPAIPATIQCKKCKGTGRTTDKKTEVESVCEKCQGTGVEAVSIAQCDSLVEVYQAQLDAFPHVDQEPHRKQLDRLGARGDNFLYRFEYDVSQADIDAWHADTYCVVQSIMAAQKGWGFTHNYSACNVNNRVCPYRPLCLGADPDQARIDLYDVLPEGTEAPELADQEGDNNGDDE